jgi:hypothetical protein
MREDTQRGGGKESEKRKREVDNNIWRMKNRWKESARERESEGCKQIHEKKKRYIQYKRKRWRKRERERYIIRKGQRER